jgi:hypothetical protein
MNTHSSDGYCEMIIEDMTMVSNQAICKSKVTSNIGYYMRITFPVCQDYLKYSFKFPFNFGRGGLAILDGKIKVQQTQAKNLDFDQVLAAGNHVLEIYGSSGSEGKPVNFQFKVNETNFMDMTASAMNQCYAEKEAKPAVEKPEFKSMPLVDGQIYVHTMPFEKNAIENLDELKQVMMRQPGKGYCEKVVDNMNAVGNQALCGSVVKRNVGFYYKIIFPVGQDGQEYEFKIPNDFGHGGIVFVDGKI